MGKSYPKKFKSTSSLGDTPGGQLQVQPFSSPESPAPSSLPELSSLLSLPQYPMEDKGEIPLSYWSKAMDYWGREDARDLAALLAYGPPHIPYTYGWTDNRVEQVRHFKQTQYVCIDMIASAVASQMPNVSWIETEGDETLELSDEQTTHSLRVNRARASWQRQKALTPLLTHERLKPVPSTHPLYKLLKDPNNQDTSWDLWYETVMFLLLTGSAYWWIPPGIGNLPAAIWVIGSHWMWPIIGKEKIIEAWEIRPVEGNYLRRRLPADQIVHFKKKNPVSKLDGMAVLTAINQWVDVQESISKAAWWSYKQGPLPNVAISFDGTMNDPTDEQLRRIEAKFLTRYGGENRAGKPIFTPPGVKITPLSIKPNQMVFSDIGKDTMKNIMMGYGVPPGLCMLEGETLKDQESFYSRTVNPLCRFLAWTITERVAKKYPKSKTGGELRVWWEAHRTDDSKQLNEDLKVDMLASSISPNEVRVLRGRQPWEDPEMDKPIRPVNMENAGTLPGGGSHNDGEKPPKHKPNQPALNPDDSKYYLGEDGEWVFNEQ